MISVVATRYAHALVDVVTAPNFQGDTATVLGQLHSIQDLIDSSPELRAVFASPAVPPSRKRAVMGKLMESMNLLPEVRNFVFVVIQHRRVHDFPSILEAFETALDERLGFIRADVRSAHQLSDAHRANLEAQVARLAGRKAKLRYTIEPALIAGVVARVGSRVYDGSVRGQLDRLRSTLVRS